MQTSQVYPYYCRLASKRGQLFWKRWLDFVLSSLLLLLLWPVMAGIALWIKLDSPGPVFFRQERVTQYGRIFRIYKFRTMVDDAERKGSLVTAEGDSRITRVGTKLRGCRLDELPQLINIWKGEMSFVGTRPEVEKYVARYTDRMKATLLMPAGITSEASIMYKDEARLLENAEDADEVYVEKVLPEKMKYNLSEIENFGFGKGLRTMVKTIAAVFR